MNMGSPEFSKPSITQPNVAPKTPETVDVGRRKILRIFVGGAIASATGIAFGAGDPTQLQKEKTTFEDLQTSVNEYIKNLGMFGKLALVNEIKEKADTLITTLKEKSIRSPEIEAIAAKSGSETKTVLTKFIQGVRKLPENEEKRAVGEIIKMVTLVKETSVSDLRAKFS